MRPEVVARVHELELELVDRRLLRVLRDGHVVLLDLRHVDLELPYELLLVLVMRIPPANTVHCKSARISGRWMLTSAKGPAWPRRPC